MAVEVAVDLSVADFAKHHEYGRLGRLTFPNGRCGVFDGRTNLFISLQDLFVLTTHWAINRPGIPVKSVLEIIAFGPAVQTKRHQTVSRRKYFLFGPVVERTVEVKPPSPWSADFLVITTGGMYENVDEHRTLNPVTGTALDFDTEFTYAEEGGINVFTRGIGTFGKGAKAPYDDWEDDLRDRVPLFYDSKSSGLLSDAGFEISNGGRSLRWFQDQHMRLNGTIN